MHNGETPKSDLESVIERLAAEEIPADTPTVYRSLMGAIDPVLADADPEHAADRAADETDEAYAERMARQDSSLRRYDEALGAYDARFRANVQKRNRDAFRVAESHDRTIELDVATHLFQSL